MEQTAVEFLLSKTAKHCFNKDEIEQARSMENEQSHSYAEFAIKCDRKDIKILNFEDYIKL